MTGVGDTGQEPRASRWVSVTEVGGPGHSGKNQGRGGVPRHPGGNQGRGGGPQASGGCQGRWVLGPGSLGTRQGSHHVLVVEQVHHAGRPLAHGHQVG